MTGKEMMFLPFQIQYGFGSADVDKQSTRDIGIHLVKKGFVQLYRATISRTRPLPVNINRQACVVINGFHRLKNFSEVALLKDNFVVQSKKINSFQKRGPIKTKDSGLLMTPMNWMTTLLSLSIQLDEPKATKICQKYINQAKKSLRKRSENTPFKIEKTDTPKARSKAEWDSFCEYLNHLKQLANGNGATKAMDNLLTGIAIHGKYVIYHYPLARVADVLMRQGVVNSEGNVKVFYLVDEVLNGTRLNTNQKNPTYQSRISTLENFQNQGVKYIACIFSPDNQCLKMAKVDKHDFMLIIKSLKIYLESNQSAWNEVKDSINSSSTHQVPKPAKAF